jgi:hypothetical protein
LPFSAKLPWNSLAICRAALEEIGKVASALGSDGGRKTELPWMADQMLENARGRSVALAILNY